MSWSGTYAHNILYAVDVLASMLFWNQSDVTISSLCRIVQLADFAPGLQFAVRLKELKLYGWQVRLLRGLAPALDKIQKNHCELARQADLARAARVTTLLT